MGTTEIRILKYVLAHPRAMDSVEGIQQWWLIDRQVTKREIQNALMNLIQLEYIIMLVGLNGSASYKLNQAKMGEMRSILNQT